MSDAELTRGWRTALLWAARVARDAAKEIDARPFRRAHEGASLALHALADELEEECAAHPQPEIDHSTIADPRKREGLRGFSDS